MSIWGAWIQIRSKQVPGDPILVFLGPAPRYDQNKPQETQFECFGCLGPDMAKTCSRRLHFGIFGPWAQIQLKQALTLAHICGQTPSNAPNYPDLRAGSQNAQNRASEATFAYIRGQAPKMLKMELLRRLLPISTARAPKRSKLRWAPHFRGWAPHFLGWAPHFLGWAPHFQGWAPRK